MFIAKEEYKDFAFEFKKAFNSLVNELGEIWHEYDEKRKGDFYYTPEFTKEEIELINNKLSSDIKKCIEDISLKFKYQNYLSFIKDFLSSFAEDYEKMRWLYNQLDYDAEGRISHPIDMYSIVGDPHQGKLNIIFDFTDFEKKDAVFAWILEKYKEELDKQASFIFEDYEELELVWDDVIFVNMKDPNNPQYMFIKGLIERKF